jgi:hypothetical protein
VPLIEISMNASLALLSAVVVCAMSVAPSC